MRATTADCAHCLAQSGTHCYLEPGEKSRTVDVGAEPGGEGGFIEGSGGEAENGLCGGFFGGGETRAVAPLLLRARLSLTLRRWK